MSFCLELLPPRIEAAVAAVLSTVITAVNYLGNEKFVPCSTLRQKALKNFFFAIFVTYLLKEVTTMVDC